jgi:hypothetical protein
MQSNKDNLNNLNSDQLSTVAKAKDLASVVAAEVLVPGIETPRWQQESKMFSYIHFHFSYRALV